ncbi:MAG: DUF4352 domain-containing protein [Chloroflexota bacterium]|nr:DUF4352 domain-containing protein [Chloroflexota bacterium]
MKNALERSVRYLLCLVVVLGMVLGSTVSTLAQATPEAEGAGGPELGETVVLFDSGGDPSVNIAVTTLNDPDDEVENADRGFHWVGIEVVIENVGNSPYSPNVYGIQLVDGEGFISSASFASRSSEDYTARPDLSSTEVEAGATVSGWLFFQVINGAEPAWIVLNDSFGTQQFAVLANLQGTEIEDGSVHPVYDASAEEIGTVSVDEIIVGFEDVDPSVSADRGQQVVGVNVTIENTGEADLEPNSYAFYLVDDLGYLYYPSYFFRDTAGTEAYPDLTSETLAPGASVTGLITYQIPSVAEVSYVIYQPDFSQLYLVAQPGEGSVTSGDTLEPVEVPTESGDDPLDEPTEESDDPFGDPTEEATGGEETGDCIGVTDWANATGENLAVLEQTDNLDQDIADVDPDELRDFADLMEEALDNQESIDVPVAAEELNDAVITFLEVYGDLMNDVADRLEDGDDPADIQADIENDEAFTASFTELFEASVALSEACPASNLDEIFG